MSAVQLKREAELSRRLSARAEETLARAIRDAVASGLSQREIAAAVGLSQAEVSRRARFRGESPMGRLVRQHRGEIQRIAKRHGMRNVRVFGSVARGEDSADSDLDLLVDVSGPVGLIALGRIEAELAAVVGVPVEITPDRNLKPYLAERVYREAIPL